MDKPSDKRFRDWEGKVVDTLIVGEFLGRTSSGHTLWKCRCSCGNEFSISSCMLLKGRRLCAKCRPDIRGLACVTHGMAYSSEYEIWGSMKKRCLNPACAYFEDYGGRGIKIHGPWIESFDCFLSDVGPRPSIAHTLDRLDNDGNYEPGNVRWATRKEQARNRRSNRVIELDGIKKSLAEWAEISGVHWCTIRMRLEAGWRPELAVYTPRWGRTRGTSYA